MIIDTHCHLNDERIKSEASDIIEAFPADGIESVICVGCDLPSSLDACEMADKYEKVYAAAGMHPHDSKFMTDSVYDTFEKLAQHPKTVAIGEIGLDYFYDLSPRDIQAEVFIKQLEFADCLKLPVVLHIRDAYEDARKILTENKRFLNNGLMLHCYSGSAEYVKIFNKFDAYYSFGGAITFKNARHNIESLAAVPKDRLTLETDCPYMTPVPFRGKTNYPKYISYVADKAAETLGIERSELEELTSRNARTLFKKLK